MTVNLQQMRDRSWNFDPDELLYSYVGRSYGWDDMDVIVREKSQHEAWHVCSMIELVPEDVVLDLGSGFGHIAMAIAPQVKRYICADISTAMMEQCVKFTADIPNISYEIFDRPKIQALSLYQPTKIFANSVFIHMTMFEIVIYMRQAFEMLPKGGMLYFNINDADYLAIGDDGAFEDMLLRWLRDPNEITLMHWNSFSAIRGIAQRIGFELRTVKKGQWSATSITFAKY